MPQEPTVHYVKPRAGKEQEFINGVPARDVPQGEWDALPEDRKAEALASGRYKLPEPPAAVTAPEPKTEDDAPRVAPKKDSK